MHTCTDIFFTVALGYYYYYYNNYVYAPYNICSIAKLYNIMLNKIYNYCGSLIAMALLLCVTLIEILYYGVAICAQVYF